MSFLNPENSVEYFGLDKDMIVADLGAGSGFYTIACAKKVGPKGRVYAVDIQKDLLDRIKSRANMEGLVNIEVVWGDIEKMGGTKLASCSVDLVVVANVIFQVEDKKSFLSEIDRILKEKGKVVVVGWRDSWGGIDARPEGHMSKEDTIKLFEENGFIHEKEITPDDSHFSVIFSMVNK